MVMVDIIQPTKIICYHWIPKCMTYRIKIENQAFNQKPIYREKGSYLLLDPYMWLPKCKLHSQKTAKKKIKDISQHHYGSETVRMLERNAFISCK